jgi:hypothetical protein
MGAVEAFSNVQWANLRFQRSGGSTLLHTPDAE